MIKNNSKGKPYYTQRNNELDLAGACNVTAMIQGLTCAGWPLPSGAYKQPEDSLLHFIRHDPVILKEWKRVDPHGKYPPNEWHSLLCMGTNRFLISNGIVGKKIITFCEDCTLLDFKLLIDSGGVAVFSGQFKSERGTIGHIVTGVGYQCDNSGTVTEIIIDDPWGDYHSLYRVHKGDDIMMPKEDFYALFKPIGSTQKRAHLIPKYEKAGV